MFLKKLQLFILFITVFFFISQNSAAKKSNFDKLMLNTTLVSENNTLKTNKPIIEEAIYYSAKDSIIIKLENNNIIHMFGESSIKYKNLNLSSEYIEMNANKNTIFATFALDSVGKEIGAPILKDGETQYEMKKIHYNFKTKKMLINNAFLQKNEGYITAPKTKKMPNNDFYLLNGRYTTCDEEHPHFYFQLTKAKVQQKNKIITGPTYLVFEDVPLPIVLPFCFFSQKGNYTSGIIIPSYGEEKTRGFSLQNGGYYFALNNYIDLSLTGVVFSKGSWGLDVHSTYRKKYKAFGNIKASYRVTIIGEKYEKNYFVSKDIKLNWIHNQDPKANPFSTLSANVNLSTNSYNRNDLNSLYTGQYTQNSNLSSINYNYKFFDSPFAVNLNVSINQIPQTAKLDLVFPNLILTMRKTYLFRKNELKNLKWYENICMSYSGLASNSIKNIKEYDFFSKNHIKNWKNGIKHELPVSTSFNIFKHVIIIPSINYTELWYPNKINQKYDWNKKKLIHTDTIYGFYRIHNYNTNININTKLYGLFKIWPCFCNKWMKQIQIRHIFTPSINLNSSPSYNNSKHKYYEIIHINDHDTIYSPFSHNLWGVPEIRESKIINFILDNNLEIKTPINKVDSIQKLSLIDNLKLEMNYNYSADSINWSDINASARFKLKQHVLGVQTIFDPYIYNKQGIKINMPRWKVNKGIGRLKYASTFFSYNLNNEIIKKWFTKKNKKNTFNKKDINNNTFSKKNINLQQNFSQKIKNIDYDEDGYLLMNILWDLNLDYSFSLNYNSNVFNESTKEYSYKTNQTLNITGNINPTKNWSINFNTDYDFNCKKIVHMSCSIIRLMHCWTIAANIVPMGPSQTYYFTIATNSSILKDLKYTQSGHFM